MRRISLSAATLGLWLVTAVTGVPVEAQRQTALLEIHHIHGLTIDVQDPEVVYVATHTGLVRLGTKATPAWVGEQRFDLMGFTVDSRDPKIVYASGHPDVATYSREKVANLGVLVSRDGGMTWQSVALKGQADFHALTFSPRDGGQLFGWSVVGQTGLHRISTATWTAERLPARGLADVLSLSASPDGAAQLLAGTTTGLRASRDGGLSWTAVKSLPVDAAVTAVAHHRSDPRRVVAYVNRAGAGLMLSRDGGDAWEAAGFFAGVETPVIALAAGPGDHLVVATTRSDIARTRDGRNWEKPVERGRLAAEKR